MLRKPTSREKDTWERLKNLGRAEKLLFYIFTFVAWMLLGCAVIVATQLLKSLPVSLPGHQSLEETLKNLSNVRMWELVGLPVMAGGGVLGTLLQTLFAKNKRRSPKDAQ